ncbi:MAG: RecX family transcriptional regulator [Bryobacteraceae bacterium]|nr:RecX family transcriptional regulator [Bryobacteraceae bacterium]
MKPKRLLAEAELLDYALKALGTRAASAGELREKLRQRAEKKGDVEPVLAKLREYGYLDDKRFAENFAARRLENEGFGKARVLRDLRTRRVAPALAEKAVNAAFEGSDEEKLIEQYLARKYRRQPLGEVLGDAKGLAAAFRKLRGAGFSSANALKVLKKHSRDTETLDQLESAGLEGEPEEREE